MALLGAENCAVCGDKCGVTSRTRLADGYCLCSECLKTCSVFLTGFRKLTLPQISEHIAYMQERDGVFKSVFSAGGTKNHFVSGEYGIIVNLDEGLFRAVSPESAQRIYTEVFRCTELRHCEYYELLECASAGKKYCSGVGVKLFLDNPWYSEARVPFAPEGRRLTQSEELYGRRAALNAIICLDRLAGRTTNLPPELLSELGGGTA